MRLVISLCCRKKANGWVQLSSQQHLDESKDREVTAALGICFVPHALIGEGRRYAQPLPTSGRNTTQNQWQRDSYQNYAHNKQHRVCHVLVTVLFLLRLDM